MLARYVVFAEMLLVSSQAIAANWLEVAKSTDGAVWSVDILSVKDVTESYNVKARKVWVKIDYSKVTSQIAREAKVLFFIKCNEEQAKSTTWVLYKADGTVLRDVSRAYSTYDAVVPETVLSGVVSAVCYES
jgi:hypothetical protein